MTNSAVTVESETPRSFVDVDHASAEALRIYREVLSSQLEPEHLGRMVAIHPDTGDYAVGADSPAARFALRERRPKGMIVTMSIGPDRPHPALDRMLDIGT